MCKYDTFSNKNPELATELIRDRRNQGKLDTLVDNGNKNNNSSQLFIDNSDNRVTSVTYSGNMIKTNPNPILTTNTGISGPLEDLIRRNRLLMSDPKSIYGSATVDNPNDPRYTAAGRQNPFNGAGKRNKSKKPKRRNSRSNRRKTLNKSKH